MSSHGFRLCFPTVSNFEIIYASCVEVGYFAENLIAAMTMQEMNSENVTFMLVKNEEFELRGNHIN